MKFSAFPKGYKNPFTVNYSSIVDTSRFTTNDKSKRAAQNGVDSSSMKGLYDLDGTEKDQDLIDKKLPDNILIALREGRLDKVEIEKVKQSLIAENERLSKENLSKSEAKKRQQQYDRQMAVIDEALGLSDKTEHDSQNLGKASS